MDPIDIIISIFLGLGLAAAVGFRVFLPLLVLSLAGHYEMISLHESWQWIGSLTAVVTLAIATLIEIFGYYIPWFDNALDVIAIPLAAVAGTAVMVATVSNLDPIITWSLAIIAGGGTATLIKGNASALRLGATATTGGIGNPIVTTLETATATIISIFAIFIPIIAFILVLFILFGIYKFYKKLGKKSKSSV